MMKLNTFLTLLLSLVLFGAFTVVADDYDGIAKGALYIKAQEAVRLGNYDLSSAIIERLKDDTIIGPWAKLLAVEAQISKQEYSQAENSLKNVILEPKSHLQKLYKEKLTLELSLLDKATAIVNSKKMGELTLRKTKLLKSELSYLSALSACKRKEFKTCLLSLQDVQLVHPKTIAAHKARIIADDLVKSIPSLSPVTASRGYIIKEVRSLQINQKPAAALTTLEDGIARNIINDQSEKSVFDLKISLLDATSQTENCRRYIANLAEKPGPLRYSALSELATRAWNKNEHAELEQRLKQIGKTPFSAYLEARAAEEKGDYTSAIKSFNWLYQIGGHPYIAQTGFRLSWLYLREGKFKEAARVLTRLKKVNPRDNYYDSEAITYWSDLAQQQKPASKVSYLTDPRLYYYWLKKGASIARPYEMQNQEPLRQLVSSVGCNHHTVALPEGTRSYLAELATYGMTSILEDEVSLALKERNENLGEIRARANFVKDLGAPAGSIKELRASESAYARIEKECLGAVIDILYPHSYLDVYKNESARTGVDPLLLMAITRTESAYDPLAISRSGAMGLMQLIPPTAELEGFTGYKDGRPEDAFRPNVNIRLGANHLKRLFDKYGDQWHLAIAAYNAGGQAVDRWLTRYPNTPPEIWVELISYKETRNYVKKVLGAYWAYKFASDISAKICSDESMACPSTPKEPMMAS